MWHRLKNFFYSLQTYDALSPDLRTRRIVNRWLRDRPPRNVNDWYDAFWQHHNVSRSVVAFAYTHLEKYSGLQLARVLPSDRLEEDLRLTLVCWFDWHITLCEDFHQCLGVSIQDDWELTTLTTVEEFVLFLHRQMLSVNHL